MPAPKKADESTYAGRFAARLRELREKAGLSVDAMSTAMCAAGYETTSKSLYNWESAFRQPPIDAYPFLASVLQLKSIRALLPEK